MSIKSWIIRIVKKWEKEYYEQPVRTLGLSSGSGPHLSRDNSIGFYLHKANGGWVLDVSHYNESVGESIKSLYIIMDESDIGHELSKIISIESLRR